mmetsp:Transcript_20351/g.23382  ORF Transcript_20351/g.23382 Transcript_20351/m.23382 type:complete len:86 (+) Transcript_20351:355-612(+)
MKQSTNFRFLLDVPQERPSISSCSLLEATASNRTRHGPQKPRRPTIGMERVYRCSAIVRSKRIMGDGGFVCQRKDENHEGLQQKC